MSESQKVGRLTEIFVEQKLTENDWLCGNFNNSVTNAPAWDLFAKKGNKTRVIRVKGASSTDITWNVRNGITDPLPDFDPSDNTDWTAIVVNVSATDQATYLVPTAKLVKHIHDAGLPNDWAILHLHFREPKKDVNFPGQYGLDTVFAAYKDNWDM